jgi:hypothetical protein
MNCNTPLTCSLAGGFIGFEVGINLPGSLSFFSAKRHFNDEVGKDQIVNLIANKVSSLYADCLKHEWHSKRSEENPDLKFCGFPSEFPSAKEVELFENKLNDRIIEKLNEGDEDYDRVYLSTDYAPEKLLSDVLQESKISWRNYDLNKLFPVKTSTTINVWNTAKKIEVRMTI